MPLDISNHRKLTRGALACVFGAVLLVAGNVGSALAGDDDQEDELPDVKLLRGLLHGLGLKGPNDGPNIDYRERSPLVVPPTRDLPPPETDVTVKDPDWPVDPDVKKRKEAARAQKNRAPYDFMEDSRPLRPDELRKGTAITKRSGGKSNDGEDGPMRPSELGYKDSIFSFSSIKSIFGGSEEETAKFTGEPPRESLTEPPPGYQTPSPEQPYGINAKAEPSKPMTLYERAEGNAGR
ncbi:MAG TPA: hypothetical protein VG985_04175 [Xanthobacteraceae bacterium]|nr:hypothetical protein [Xanthobacteraceae bacterium]